MRVLIFALLFVFHVVALGNVIVVDVRTAGEFSEEHAKGALNIDVMAEDFEKKVSSLDKNGDYVVYCKAGGRSAKAMDKMKALGFKKIKNLGTVEKAIKAYGKDL